MSGAEGFAIAALVPACISAYNALANEYRAWRRRRAERKKKSENVQLQSVLHDSGQTVQDDYNNKLTRLGSAFQKGDEIGCSQFEDQIIYLQKHIIDLLTQKKDDLASIIHPYHNHILNGSTNVRDNIITIFEQQSQRLEQARPLLPLQGPAIPTPPPPYGAESRYPPQPEPPMPLLNTSAQSSYPQRSSCAPAWARNCSQPVRNAHGPPFKYKEELTCGSCGWFGWVPKLQFLTKDNEALDDVLVFNRFHYRHYNRKGWRCFICGATDIMDRSYWFYWWISWEDLRNHLRQHTYADITD